MDIKSLRELLKTNVVTVVFTKKDGSLREMHCSTMQEYLASKTTSNEIILLPENPETLTVWDLEQNGWRSFRFDSVKTVETDDFFYEVPIDQ